jgi:hypothetical protein
MLCATALIVLAAHAAQAQDITIPVNIDRLSAKAVESVNVTVDGALLQLAAKFLSQSDPEQRAVKNLISNLKGVYVRSFEFAGPGEYSDADVDALRAQLKAPLWSRMVNVRSTRGGRERGCVLQDGEGADRRPRPHRCAAAGTHGRQYRRGDRSRSAGSLGGHFGIPKVDAGTVHK